MSDTLAEINGVKPLRYIKDGEEVEVSSQTSSSTYRVKRTVDHYYCTCPAWRNQGKVAVNARTCKHIRSILGDLYEDERQRLIDPNWTPKGGAAKGKSKAKGATAGAAKGKRKRGDDDDTAASPKKSSTKRAKADDEEDEDGDADEEDGKKANVAVLLAVKWDLEKGADPTGWWVSEKLDGVRVFYDGKRMLSRLGNPFSPPNWFIEGLPKDITLDGELFGGRNQFQSTVSIVRSSASQWEKKITFQIFDVPSKGDLPFEERMKFLKDTFGPNGTHAQDHVVVVEQTLVRNRDHVFELLAEVEKSGGEGLMLRKPKSKYEGTRSSTLQKIKTFYDGEAKVTGHEKGNGKNAGVMGALKCVMASGKTFRVGSGFSDEQRRSPPKIGTIITYRCQELTQSGVPRFPTYVGEAIDKTEPTDPKITKKSD